MTNEIQVFQNTEFGELGVIEIDGKPYFPATKCAEILGYTSPRDAIQKHCKAVAKCDGFANDGKSREINYISEPDLYRLIFGSKLPSAEKFRIWVFEEILPSIRKHGLYAAEDLLANPDLLIQAATALKEERAKNAALAQKVVIQSQQIAEYTPKVTYYDHVLQCQGVLPITVIAKDYGKSGQWLNKKLHELGIQYKRGDTWVLYQKYSEIGYTATKTHDYVDGKGIPKAKVNTYWTQKGRLFLYNELKNNGILPNIEKENNLKR